MARTYPKITKTKKPLGRFMKFMKKNRKAILAANPTAKQAQILKLGAALYHQEEKKKKAGSAEPAESSEDDAEEEEEEKDE